MANNSLSPPAGLLGGEGIMRCKAVKVKTTLRVDFCKASKIINNKSHLNEKGLEELKQIKSGMNSGRVH
jgi:hypothetical protein